MSLQPCGIVRRGQLEKHSWQSLLHLAENPPKMRVITITNPRES